MIGQCSECKTIGRIRRGLCEKHYMRAYRAGKLEEFTERRIKSKPICRIEGCDNPTKDFATVCRQCRYLFDKGCELDEDTGLFADEEEGAQDFSGNGRILCEECGRPTSEHDKGEFCYKPKEGKTFRGKFRKTPRKTTSKGDK